MTVITEAIKVNSWAATRYNEGVFAYLITHAKQSSPEQTELEVSQLDTLITAIDPGWKDHEVLDVAGGYGRHAFGFIHHGVNHITVADQSVPFLMMGETMSYAAGLSGRIDFSHVDARDLSPLNRQFRTITCLGNSILGYSEDPQDDLRFLVSVRKALDTGGTFVLDVQDGDVMKEKYKDSVSESCTQGEYETTTERHVEGNRIHVHEVIKKSGHIVSDEVLSMRLYSQQEIFNLLALAGFSQYSNGHKIQLGNVSGTMSCRSIYFARTS